MVLSILMLALGVRLAAAQADVRFHADEALFATFARSAAVHGDWWLSGTLDKPPLALYLMALTLHGAAVTVNPLGVLDLAPRAGEWAARLPAVWCGVLTCAALMAWAARAGGRWSIGLWAGLLWAASPTITAFEAMALTDAPMLAGLAVALAAQVNGRGGLAGAGWGAALASKQQAVLMLPAVILPLLPRQHRAQLRRFGLTAAAAVSLLLLWDALRPGDSFNSVAAGNNNPYRLLTAPSEWPARAGFWWAVMQQAFGGLGGWLTAAGLLMLLRQRRFLAVLYPCLYLLAHIVLPFNLYERYALPALLMFTLPMAVVLAGLACRRWTAALPALVLCVVALTPAYLPTTARDRHTGLNELADFVNAQGLGTIVYNPWLGWEMGYYLGPWSDKRVVYYPTPQDLAADAPLNPDRAPRLLIAPDWAAIDPWLTAAARAGFVVSPAYDGHGYAAWWLTVEGDRAPQTAQTAPSSDADCPTVERTTLDSPRLRRAVTVTVYLPCRPPDATDPLPYLVFLHGSNSDDRQLVSLGLTELAPAYAVLMPSGEAEANTNLFSGPTWGDAVLELLPQAEARWSLDPNRRAIGGISRGGFWAYQIALRHPQQFRAVGGHSAFFDPYHAEPQDNPLDLAAALSPADAPRLYLDRGADDYAAPGLDRMNAALKRAGIPHTYLVHPTGQHTEDYWREHLPDYLAFYADALTETPPDLAAEPMGTQADGVALFVPAAAFPSPLYTLDTDTWAALLAGQLLPKLTVSEAVRDALTAYGVALHPDTRVLDTALAVENELFRDRSRWTLAPWDGLNLRLRVLLIDEQHPVDMLAAGGYTLAFADTATPNFSPSRLSRVMVSGVTALARGTLNALRANGVEWAAQAIAPITTRADLFHLSSEVSVIDDCPAAPDAPRLGGSSSFCGDPDHLRLFALLGADVIELSGNHNADYGHAAYLDTLERLHAGGWATVGGGQTLAEARAPFIWQGAGGSVAWVACNAVGPYYALADDAAGRPGAAACDASWLRAELPRLKAAYDVVILTVQYAEFDQHAPTDAQRRDFATYAAWGADYVGGTQAHFPQALNVIAGYGGQQAFVHYGLGNFLFDQTFWAGVRFLLDELYIYDGHLHTVGVYAGIIDGQGRPRLMTAQERDNFWFVLFNQHGEF